jgi:hypothetical protein
MYDYRKTRTHEMQCEIILLYSFTCYTCLINKLTRLCHKLGRQKWFGNWKFKFEPTIAIIHRTIPNLRILSEDVLHIESLQGTQIIVSYLCNTVLCLKYHRLSPRNTKTPLIISRLVSKLQKLLFKVREDFTTFPNPKARILLRNWSLWFHESKGMRKC